MVILRVYLEIIRIITIFKSDNEYFSNMGRDVRPLVIIIPYALSLWGSSTVTGSDFKCDKNGKQSYSYTCMPTTSEGTFTIPENSMNDVQYLSIEAEDNTTWSVTQPDVFKKLSHLNVLHINTTKTWHIPNASNIEFEKLKQDLFTAPSLQILRVAYSKEYNKVSHQWKLTRDLKHLYSKNSVLDFDLRTSDNLYSLSLINASLDKIPQNNGLNFLAALDLRYNTLKNMTALDLASFCSLETINLRHARINECECELIGKLFQDMKKHNKCIAHYRCTRSTNNSCSSLNWADVKKKRDSCLDNVASCRISQFIKILFASGGTLFVIICICVFVLQYLNEEESS